MSILSKLRLMSEYDFSLIADVGEGLEYRLRKAICDAESLDDFFEKIRTKRYTLSKLRRIILCSYLGVTKNMQNKLPGYINVLASNTKGMELVSKIKDCSDFGVVIRYSDSQNLSKEDKDLYEFISRCDDLFGMTLPKIRPVGYDKTHMFRLI